MKNIFSYIIFGIFTTIVNVVSFFCLELIGIDYKTSTIIAWVLSVIFAYITNKKYVFKSTTKSVKETTLEFSNFTLGRILSLLIDLLCMFIFIDVLNISNITSKIATNVLVVVINYFISKLFVFKKTSND
ncbi:MAG: GtrA family protein [Clostridiales bacterium]|nr:GtrA family protein [Clostridiales bacterium]